jgi:hypothetical protein
VHFLKPKTIKVIMSISLFSLKLNIQQLRILQYAQALATPEGYRGYGPEQGNKVSLIVFVSSFTLLCFT